MAVPSTKARVITILLLLVAVMSTGHAWGVQGHRLVGVIAFTYLTPIARQNVVWLLEHQSLADVASWADRQVDVTHQTFYWHFLNIPSNATGYDRDRDCPRQPGVAAGARGDRWRDCAVDRILYHEERLADRSLDRADRATALKFLVHLVGDLHQPFHALGVGRGGNDIPVRAFGAASCSSDPARPVPCNLHSVWDSGLIAHRGLDDRRYLVILDQLIEQSRWLGRAPGSPAHWAVESFHLAKPALVTANANIDEAYYAKHIAVVDQRLALAGVRLAAMLNRVFITPPK
jgi:hypothetical protein